MKKSSKKIIGLLLVAILLLSTQMISAKAASDAKLYTAKGHTITVKAKKGKDISKPLNAALRAASKKAGKKIIYTVRVPKGNYLVKDVIHLYGNVCLNLTGSTLKCSMSSGNMLLLGDSQINENAKEISKQAADLYDKFVGFLNDFEDIGKSIDKSKESYDKAINKLSSGRGNLISRSQKFLELGVKPTKEISSKYIKDEE